MYEVTSTLDQLLSSMVNACYFVFVGFCILCVVAIGYEVIKTWRKP